MNDPPRRPRGRPRVAEPGRSVSVWLPVSQCDRLIKLAVKRDASVADTLRRLLVKSLHEQ